MHNSRENSLPGTITLCLCLFLLCEARAAEDKRPATDFVRVIYQRSGVTGHFVSILASNSEKTRAIKVKVRYWTKYPYNHTRTPHYVTATIQPLQKDCLIAIDTSGPDAIDPQILTAEFDDK